MLFRIIWAVVLVVLGVALLFPETQVYISNLVGKLDWRAILGVVLIFLGIKKLLGVSREGGCPPNQYRQ